MARTLLIGGARSGKSSLAVRWAQERCTEVCCLVTAIAPDPEMAERIERHRQGRPEHWRVREAPVRLGSALREEARTPALLLVDCLTLWTSNCLWPPDSPRGEAREWEPDVAGWRAERDEFLAALQAANGPIILVTNEVGTGIVPANQPSRLFRDEHGWLNQLTAALCDEVFLVTAGLALRLK